MPTVAVVGTGIYRPCSCGGAQASKHSCKRDSGLEPQQKANGRRRLWGLSVGYAAFEDVLADDEVTVIHITSPNRFHLEQAAKALEAHKHVVCEKPLAMNTDETGRLVALAKAHPDLVTAVNYNVRFYPLVLHARDLIRQGVLGDVYTVTGGYVQDWLLKDTDWKLAARARPGRRVAGGRRHRHALDGSARLRDGPKSNEPARGFRNLCKTAQKTRKQPRDLYG